MRFRRRSIAGRRIHDYRQRYLGHDYTLTPDPNPVTARIIGWGDGLRARDLIVIPRQEGGTCLYEIETLRWANNVDDMWLSHCRFVPGSSELGQKVAAATDERRESFELWWVLRG